jgi:DNA uptake protein ComE-like DNA-binding protein
MKKIKSLFLFSSAHRSGIFLFIFLIFVTQIFYFALKNSTLFVSNPNENEKWLAIQNEIDQLKSETPQHKDTIYPFNPNFITDYKGYKLGMSVAEIDRLHEFRATNKYVNSAKEFQQITKVPNDLLAKLQPYFKFPDWVNKPKSNFYTTTYAKFDSKPSTKIIVKDINLATEEDLIAAFGIGEKLASKILEEKAKFGQFVSLEQLQFIWGISPEAFQDLQKRFIVKPSIIANKFAINDVSIKELAKFPYFNYSLASEIVMYRTMNNGIKDIADLSKIKGMPNEKIKIIALYLQF